MVEEVVEVVVDEAVEVEVVAHIRIHIRAKVRIAVGAAAAVGLAGFVEAVVKRALHRLHHMHQQEQRAVATRTREEVHRRVLATKKRLLSRPVISVLPHTAIIMRQTFTIVVPINFDRCRIHINATFNLSSQTLQQVSVNVFARSYFL